MIDFDVKKGYAFSGNEREKSKAVHERFSELTKKYSIGKTNSFSLKKMTEKELEAEMEKFDIFISREPKYHHSIHTVLKNNTDLSNEDMLIICDSGNLCFGGPYEGHNQYRISED